MAFAISLKATNDTADPIRELWEEVAQLESRPSIAALDYLPHLTLAVYDDIPPAVLRLNPTHWLRAPPNVVVE